MNRSSLRTDGRPHPRSRPVISPSLNPPNVDGTLIGDDELDHMMTAKLITATDALEKCNEQRQKSRLRSEVLQYVRTLVDARYDGILRRHALASTSLDDHRTQLLYIIHCLTHSHRVLHLNAELVKWVMAKLLLSKVNIFVEDMIGGFLQDCILTLARRFLNKVDSDLFLRHTILQLAGLLKGETSIHFYTDSPDMGPLYRLQIDCKELSGSRNVVIGSILDLFLHGPFDFKSLEDVHRCRLWTVMFKFSLSHEIPVYVRLVNSCILLGQRLLRDSQWCLLTSRLAVDMFLSLSEELLKRTQNDTTETEELKDSIALAFKIFSEEVLDADTEQRSQMEVSKVAEWVIRASILVTEMTNKGVEGDRGQQHVSCLITMVCSCLNLMSLLDEASDFEEFGETLAELTKPIVEFVVRSKPSNEQMKHLSALLGFLVHYDVVMEKTIYREWIVEMCNRICRKLEKQSKYEELIGVHRSVAVALSEESEECRVVMRTIIPSKETTTNWIEKASCFAVPEGSRILIALFQLISDLVEDVTENTSTALAFLSIPWLTLIDLTMDARLKRNIPLLKEMNKLADQCRKHIDADVICCTLSAIGRSRVQGYSEWRRHIVTTALTSTDTVLVNAALDCFAPFVATVEPSAHSALLRTVVDLARIPDWNNRSELVCSVLTALSRAICASSPNSKVESGNIIECETCQILARDGVHSPRRMEVPDEIVDLLLRIFEDKDNSSSMLPDACQLLFVLLSHVNGFSSRYRPLISSSLSLITQMDDGVRSEYLACFKVIMSDDPYIPHLRHIRSIFGTLGSEMAEDALLRKSCEMAPFLVVVAVQCADRETSSSSFVELLVYWIRTAYPTTELSRHVREMIKLKTVKDIGSNDSRKLFLRNCRSICEKLADELAVAVFNLRNSISSKDQAENRSPTSSRTQTQTIGSLGDEEIEIMLDNCGELFGFDSLNSFLSVSTVHIVSYLLINCDPDVYFKDDIFVVLDRIRGLIGRTKVDMLSDVFPSVIEKCIQQGKCQKAEFDKLRKTYSQYASIAIEPLYMQKRFLIVYYMIRNLSVDEHLVLHRLSRLGPGINRATLTQLLSYNCEYLGFLLSFRRHLLDDEHFELRDTMLNSLCILISTVDSKFLNDSSNKLLIVLREATSLGEPVINVWLKFVKHLSSSQLALLLPQVLIAIQPLRVYDSFQTILSTIFVTQRQLATEVHSESFIRTALVLASDDDENSGIGQFLESIGIDPNDKNKVIDACVRMLNDECDVVGRVVLRRLLSILDGFPLEDTVVAQIVPALLYTLRNCSHRDLRLLVSRCLGRMGAVDPGRLGLSLAHRMLNRDTQEKTTVFVDVNGDEFFVYLFERCWRVYTAIEDAEMIYNAEYCIQTLLGKLVGKADERHLMSQLSAECRKDIEPLRSTKLHPRNEAGGGILNSSRPLCKFATDFPNWLNNCFIMGVRLIQSHPLCEVFRALKWISFVRDTGFIREMIPQLIIQLIVEKNMSAIQEYTSEFAECLREAVSHSGWVRMAANVVFSTMDVLEKYAVSRIKLRRGDDTILSSTKSILNYLSSLRLPDGSVLIVSAAEKCGCLLRALRWCEQYAVPKNKDGSDAFDMDSYYTLQRVYTSLQDTDGVLGAFQTIATRAEPTPDQLVLAREATGDYSEALPLYKKSTENKELKLIKCLLCLNEPQLALTAAEQLYQQYSIAGSPLYIAEDCQLEAAWHLRSWEKLEDLVQKYNPMRDVRDTSWGASCASIMNAVRLGYADVVDKGIEMARERLVDRLVTMTIEDSDAYAQSYTYITQLHILDEIDEHRVLSPNGSFPSVERTLDKWEKRSETIVQCASVLEPVLRVRRELLSTRGTSANTSICQLLLQSSRLARQAGQMQIAWTYLVEAKDLGVEHMEVAVEEARFQFQKGVAPAAIGILSKLLSTRFGKLLNYFNGATQSSNRLDTQQEMKRAIVRIDKQERNKFAEVQLLHAEYMQKAGTKDIMDLYKIYKGLLMCLDVKSEDLYYRTAVFFDSITSTSVTEATPTQSHQIATILNTYQEVLKHGRSHLFHVMPRMLTIWLDTTEQLRQKAESAPANQKKTLDEDIMKLNNVIQCAHKSLDPYMFYTCFPQMISRILHSSEDVFDLLKQILVKQILQFPHQCLWQSIGVYRPDNTKKGKNRDPKSEKIMKDRGLRIYRIYEVAERQRPEIRELIDQYDYVAGLLLEFGELTIKPGNHTDIASTCPDLYKFFIQKKMNVNHLTRRHIQRQLKEQVDTTKGEVTVVPKIMVPLTELMEKALPRHSEQRVESLTQIVISDDNGYPSQLEFREEVFVEKLEENFLVLSSMQRPKKFSFLGNDGKVYDLMAKAGDELRKDARFNDVNRMMNDLMRRNADSRRRQLMVKTFTVVPLAAHGGILEWLPNLTTYRSVISPLCEEKSGRKSPSVDPGWFKNLSDEERVRKFREMYYGCCPVVMAEWFRRSFSDPCSWHAARLGYARSTAVMSMIGFVMGLGDRHGDNILIDQRDGIIVHVDYNLIFNRGEALGVPEAVPFRLTRNMVNGLGPTGVEGAYRKSCEVTMRVMRENKDTLLTVIGSFVHDPLVEFFAVKAQQNKQNSGVSSSNLTSDYATASVKPVERRLEGHIVSSSDFLKSTTKMQLNCAPMCVEGQVNKLIEIAMDEHLLSAMFVGWSAWL